MRGFILALGAALLAAPIAAAKNPRLVVGIDDAFPPYQFVDDEGQATGFDLELFAAVAEAAGIEYEVRAGNWHEIRAQLESGAIDVSPGVVHSEVRDLLLDFSIPTVQVQHAAFVLDDSSIRRNADLKGSVVSLLRSSIWEDLLRERGYDVELAPVHSPSEVLGHVIRGEADGAILLYEQGLYLMRERSLEGLRSLEPPKETMALRFAVPEGRRELLRNLNDGLIAVRASGRYDEIYDRWLGVLHRPSLWSRLEFRLLAVAGGVALLLLVASALWSYGLRRAVTRRTQELAAADAEQRSLQAQLFRSQKMEALGRLAGGIAHDFNNVLTVIIGTIALVRQNLGSGHQLESPLRAADEASRSATDLTRQLLAFSREEEVAPREISWNRLIDEKHEMLRRLLGSPVKLEFKLDSELPEVSLDPSQASQVLLNLLVNARDAIVGGGTIQIETRSVAIGDGKRVRLSVTDDGIGMDLETRELIFEPLFTTKGDEGTGLGLSTVYGIVTQGGGSVEVESALGRGSTFHVDLPPAEPEGAPT